VSYINKYIISTCSLHHWLDSADSEPARVTLVRFVVWLVIGLVIYFLYSQRSSHLQQGGTIPMQGFLKGTF
jgi:C-terminus of AA_permease